MAYDVEGGAALLSVLPMCAPTGCALFGAVAVDPSILHREEADPADKAELEARKKVVPLLTTLAKTALYYIRRRYATADAC